MQLSPGKYSYYIISHRKREKLTTYKFLYILLITLCKPATSFFYYKLIQNW